MKHFLLFVCLIFASSVMIAQTAETIEEKEVAEEAVEGPKMQLEKTVVDYGEIKQVDDPLRKVSFTNTGTEPLLITNAKGSCGCTVPTWPREPILPGESSEIEIRYDTKRLGPINKTIKLTTNDPTGQYVVRITGRISAKEQKEGLPQKEGIFKKEPND